MSTKIICSLFLLCCATGLLAQQQSSATANTAPKTIEVEPHWFTEEQLAQMNPKQRLRLKALFSWMAPSRGKKTRDRAPSARTKEDCLANTEAEAHHLHHR